jgi:hypothetical protein
MYAIDYFKTAVNFLVPDKRKPKTVALAKALVNEISRLSGLLFGTYKEGAFLSNWAAGTYNRKDLVKYGKSIFQSEIDNNTDEPTITDNWTLVSSNFLGNDFRLKITGQKIILEYALNVWFETVYRQPPLQSDIYLTTNDVTSSTVFLVGAIETESSKISTLTSSEYVSNDYTFTQQYNLTINIPSSFFNGLAPTNDARESIIKDFADKYINAGITYKIAVY